MKATILSLPRTCSGKFIVSGPQHEFDCLLPQESFSSGVGSCCTSLSQQELLLSSVAKSLILQESVFDSFCFCLVSSQELS
jgi:hypothetical protein